MSYDVAPRVDVVGGMLPAQADINGGTAVRSIYVSDPEAFGFMLETFGVESEDLPDWKVVIGPDDAGLDLQEKQLALDLAKILTDVNEQAQFDRVTPSDTFPSTIATTLIEHTAELFGVDPRLSSGGPTLGDKIFIGLGGLTCGAIIGLNSLTDAPLPLTVIGVTYGTAIGTALSAGLAMCLREREINRPIDPKYRQVSAQLSKAVLPTFFEQS